MKSHRRRFGPDRNFNERGFEKMRRTERQEAVEIARLREAAESEGFTGRCSRCHENTTFERDVDGEWSSLCCGWPMADPSDVVDRNDSAP